MGFTKGTSGNPLGRALSEKPFADALRMEIAAAGGNHKCLREIAANLIKRCKVNNKDALPAITALADRLDGKPAQSSTVTIEKRDATDWTRAELEELLRQAVASSNGAAEEEGRKREPDSVH
jgi:hypothetical protein